MDQLSIFLGITLISIMLALNPGRVLSVRFEAQVLLSYVSSSLHTILSNP